MTALSRIQGGLVVSCQAPEESPLRDPAAMALMARAAVDAGAMGIRTRGPEYITAIRAAVSVPIIGLTKRAVAGSPVYITPTFDDARDVVVAGAHLVAIDATDRPRPDRVPAAELIRRILGDLGVEVVADVDSLRAGVRAATAGASAIATTLAGYTRGTPPVRPDVGLLRRLAGAVDCPVIAEGRYATPRQVAAAFRAGAFAVVVGAAITDTQALTRRFASAAPGRADPETA